MGFDTYRSGNLYIRPKGAVTLPARDTSWGIEPEPFPFLQMVADYSDEAYIETEVVGEGAPGAPADSDWLSFSGTARWYDEEFDQSLATWLAEMKQAGVSIQGTIHCSCDEIENEEWRFEVDNQAEEPLRAVHSELVYEDDERLTALARIKAAMFGDGPDTEWTSETLDLVAEAIRPLMGFPPSCPNCQDGCLVSTWCDGCEQMLCPRCWAEHNQDAPDHTLAVRDA